VLGHQLFGHRVFVGVEPQKQDGPVVGIVGEAGEGRSQGIAGRAVFRRELGKCLEALVDKAAQPLVVDFLNSGCG